MLDKIIIRIILNIVRIARPFHKCFIVLSSEFLALAQPGSMKLDEGRLVISLVPAVHTENFEWFMEDKAFSVAYYLAPPTLPPPPSASCLSFSVFLCVVGRAYDGEKACSS